MRLVETNQRRTERDKLHEIIVSNTKSLIKQLPQNSPYHRPLQYFFFQGLSKEEALEIYGTSRLSYFRALNGGGSVLLDQKYAHNVKRAKVSQIQLDEARKILDDILPVQSGRNWRYQEVTDKKLYEQYLEQVERSQAVSKSFFFSKVVDVENIHHSKSIKFCPICERYENGMADDADVLHVQIWQIQRKMYMKDKREISEGKSPGTIMVTQDFTQLELDGSFIQDLILCKYSYNKDAADGLERGIGISLEKLGTRMMCHLWQELGKLCWIQIGSMRSRQSKSGLMEVQSTSKFQPI